MSTPTRTPAGVPIDDPVDQEWEVGLEPPAVRRDRAAAEARLAASDSSGTAGDQPQPGRQWFRGGPIATVRTAWRQLTSMRTALMLLFLLAIAAVPGSILPQRPVNPLRVQQYLQENPTLGPFLDRLSGFDVFTAPWFSAIYVLLMISLVGCVLPRLRLHLRTLRQPPPAAPAHPSRLASGASWTTDMPAEVVIGHARSVLRRARFRTALGDPSRGFTVGAEKGLLRETGNLLFHFSVIGVLIGIALGSLYGYSGSVLVSEGRAFTNTRISYDAFTPGARVDPGRLQPFTFELDDFTTTYRANGDPADFTSSIRYRTDLDADERPATVKVNKPLSIGQTKLYLTGHGYSTRFVLRARDGRVVFDDYVPCTPRGATEPQRSSCTVKVPDTGLAPKGERRTPQQLAFRASLFADPVGGTAELRSPLLELSAFVGDLDLDAGVPQNVYSLDPSRLEPVRTSGVRGRDQLVQTVDVGAGPAGTITGLPDGLTLSVEGVRDWAVFATKHDPGKELVLAASVLLLIGLILTLTVRRRRIWVRAVAQDDGRTLVEVGGLARTGDLSGEFDDLVARLEARVPPLGREPRVESE